MKQIKALRTALRIDGNYYYYKGTDDVLFADMPASGLTMADGQPYQYVGYYRGSSATSASYTANAAVANGSLKKKLNLNVTVTTHVPTNNFINTMKTVHSSQTDLETSLFASGYVPNYYYGLSLRLKL